MVIAATETLLGALRTLELLDAEQFAGLETRLGAEPPDPVQLATQLVSEGLLTPFQRMRLLRGEEASLRVGPYLLLDPLGSGGMGEVFRARDSRQGQVVALKVMRKQAGQSNAVLRFLREAQAASQLCHPNVVSVHDAGVTDVPGEEAEEGETQTHYLAMELVEGIDLGRLLRQTGPLPVDLACDFIRQAALGLQHAHEHDLVHRDVKPSNLLVSWPRPAPGEGQPLDGGTVKVLDLGLVQVGTNPGASRLTQPGTVIGTVDYLSPEQARNGVVDHRSDLYSLGCTFYHALAGRPPFCGGAPLDRMLRHQGEQPPPITAFRPDVPAELAALLDQLLAKSPEDRPRTAAEVADRLIPWLNHTSDLELVQPRRPLLRPGEYDNLPPTRVMPSVAGETPTPSQERDSSVFVLPADLASGQPRPACPRRRLHALVLLLATPLALSRLLGRLLNRALAP
jgi:serine/threonine-protein kinase